MSDGKGAGVRRIVGVVSLFGRNNYGNCLQRRAVHELILRAGLEPVSFDTRSVTRDFLKEKALTAGSALPVKGVSIERARSFKSFDAGVDCKRIRKGGLSGYSRDLFAVVCGSDQVWNPRIWDFDPYVNLLGFVEPHKRIALSPSFGVAALDEGDAAVFCEELGKYGRLSTRESEGAAIVESLVDVRTEVLPDPTMAVGTSYWRNAADTRLAPARRYVLVYELGTGGECRSQAAEYARERGYELVELNRPGTALFSAGPADFLGLIFGAEAVFTDSFHASVFSIIGHVPFEVLSRKGSGYSMTSRFTSLTELFGMSTDDVGQPYDWEAVDRALKDIERRMARYIADEFRRVGGADMEIAG